MIYAYVMCAFFFAYWLVNVVGGSKSEDKMSTCCKKHVLPRTKTDISKMDKIGWGTVIRSFAVICDGAIIGKKCLIDPFVLIQPGVVVGNNCKIHSQSTLCEGVTLEDRVFIGHGVIFCNEKHPEAVREEPWELKDEDRVLVKSGAKVGNGSVILPGVTIGENAEVGAGAIVVDDVPDNGVVVSPKAVLIEHRYGRWGKFL